MRYIRDTLDFNVWEPAIVAIGKFDGLHLGHKYLISELKKGRESGLASVVFTFNIPPSSMDDRSYQVLLTNHEKVEIFSAAGVDYLIECPFSRDLKNMEPATFLRMLAEKISIRKIVVGADFAFGHNRSGSIRDLKDVEDEIGYCTVVVEKLQHEGEDISSTGIRDLVCAGRMEEANALLGYPYFILAPVSHGDRIGRKIGFPTANQRPDSEKLLPQGGVYVSAIEIGGERFRGVTNIGKRPSVYGQHPMGVETHIFDFNRRIYGKEIRVSPLKYLRPERKFASMEELRRQVEKDTAEAAVFGGLQNF